MLVSCTFVNGWTKDVKCKQWMRLNEKVVNEKVDLVNEKSAVVVVVEVNGGVLVMSSMVAVGLGDVVFEWSVDLAVVVVVGPVSQSVFSAVVTWSVLR